MGYPFTACKACMLSVPPSQHMAAPTRPHMRIHCVWCVLLASQWRPKPDSISAGMTFSRGLAASRQRHALSEGACFTRRC